MQNRKKKENEKKIALFEIFILIASITAFAYFVGNEFQFVSAFGGPVLSGAEVTPTEEELAAGTQEALKILQSLPDATVPTSAGAGSQAAATVGSSAPANPLFPAETFTGEGARFSAKVFWKAVKTNAINILGNAAIAAALYFGTKWLWSLTDWDPQLGNQLAAALAWGYGIGAGIGIALNWFGVSTQAFSLFGGLVSVSWLGIAGLGIGLVYFLLFAHKEYIAAVYYSCYPWQPVTGGADCQKCNTGEFPCTKYKCESLGQGCELLNPGTKDEICEWVNRNDISPPTIQAWQEALTEGYIYKPDTARLPPDKGVIIENIQSADGCIPPFSRITYGISLDKPGKCKIDTVRTDDFNSMKLTISNGYYKYNHTIISVHAGATELENEGIILEGGGTYETFVRCESRNGASNAGTFVFKYCVSDEPDVTAPSIKLTNPVNGMPVQQGLISQFTEVYTDKPSDCKWSHNDEDYDTMPNTMQCSQSITEINANMLYKCTTTLTGLKDNTENTFYFRCKSYPMNNESDRYKNEESYVYKLIGTKQLVIDEVKPVAGTTIKDSTQSVKVTLEAKTSAGFKDGEAKCYFKQSSETDSSYILFFNTDSYQSTQDLWLPRGSYRYTIKCCDLGGNCATSATEFIVETDFNPPNIVRVYNEGGSLKIVTDEEATCVYDTTSCSYNFDDGISMTSSDNINHFTEWNTDTNFYIKCQDNFGNQPISGGCSIIVRPFSDY